MAETPKNNQQPQRRQWRKVSHTDARILIAAAEGKMPMMESCLQNGRSLETLWRKGETPIILAAQSDHAEMVDFLIEKGANIHHVDDLGLNALCYALMGEKPEMVQKLIDKGADFYHKVPKTGQSILEFVRGNDQINDQMPPILETAHQTQMKKLQQSRNPVLKRRPKM